MLRFGNFVPPLVLVAVVGVGACKKKVPPPPPDPVPVQQVESKLQITSVSPSVVDADKATTAKVYGSNFEAGASVTFGSASATNVTVIDPNTIDVNVPAMTAGTYDVMVSNPSGESTTLRQGLTVRGPVSGNCSQATVYFGFDSAGLSSDARNLLNGNIQCYQQGSGSIRVAGHADERGTTDYNLALGNRRAETVKRHLSSQGVSGGRIQTVSYGEERPAQRGSNESAWAKNRRAEVKTE